MNLGATLLIALALAIDAFAVAIASGISLGKVSLRQTFRLAFHFGLFQSLMTLAGWAAGLTFRAAIEQVDHWAAALLLGLVGVNMIVGALKGEGREKQIADPSRGYSLVMLSVATSLDALAVGLSFSMLKLEVWTPALIIGIVAAVLTAAGMHLGQMVGAGSKLGARAELIGGLVLLAIGANILIEHGVFRVI